MDSSLEDRGTIRLGGQSLPIARLKLGRIKRLKPELRLVLAAKTLPKDELPDEDVIDAYALLVAHSVNAADGERSVSATLALIDELSPFDGIADLAVAAASVLKLTLGEIHPGEATGPATPEAETPSTSTGSTD